MNAPLKSVRGSARVVRSQFAIRLGIVLYVALLAAVFLRSMVLILGFPASVASVATILAATDPLTYPLTLIPGANLAILGSASLADLTAAIILAMAPVPLLARRANLE